MHAIDTSLLYALFNVRDQWHGQAKRSVEDHRPLLVPPGILQETLDLLRYRHGAKAAEAAWHWLANADKVVLEPRSGDASFSAVLEGQGRAGKAAGGFDPALSLADRWCVAYAVANGTVLLTKDGRQEKAFRALLSRKPA